ncbi:MAG: hypothetical protein M3Y22_01805 [Pseudomonadota bacterium]|nr:hypothetical protein [Pseudomonadota bacterium]
MRFAPLLALLGLLACCSNRLAARQAELSRWVGQPETELVGIMGAPTRSYDSGGMKFLTYEESRVEIVPACPYFGPGPFWYGGGFPPTVTNLVCDTTFTVAGGIVRAFSLRGNACG